MLLDKFEVTAKSVTTVDEGLDIHSTLLELLVLRR